LRVVAEIFAAGAAIPADAARRSEPRYADAVAASEGVDTRANLDHGADDLVTRDDRRMRLRQFTVDEVKIGAAHAARVYFE
jgi:hypothetical protein